MGHGAATEGVENGIRIPPRDFYPVCPPPLSKTYNYLPNF